MTQSGKNEIPTRTAARVGVVGKVAAKIAINELKFKAKRGFMANEAVTALKAKNDDENAKLFYLALSQLRGTATKLAQTFALEFEFFPQSYRDEMAKSFYKVPPLNRALIRKVIINEIGAPPEEIFEQFDQEAFASASIGQVHRAITKGNCEIAVKIQYPGIEQATINDLRLLNNIAQRIPKYKIFANTAKEIERGILEEVDYVLEAENTQFFAENCKTENIIIPEIIPQFCTKRILSTKYIDGKHLDEFLAERPTQAQKNYYAQTIYDFFVQSLRQLNRLHADPNPGNYLFCKGGKIAVVDFGCVKKLRPEFAGLIPQIFDAHLRQDKAKIIKLYCDLGINRDLLSDEIYDNFIEPFGQWSIAPLRNEYFDFGAEHQTELGKEFVRQFPKMEIFEGVADGFVFLNRTIYGLCKIFEKLQAKIEIKSRWTI